MTAISCKILSMNIRYLGKSDVVNAITLVWSVFDEFEAPDYSEEGVEEFRRSVNVETITGQMEKGGLVMKGFVDGDILYGVIAVRNRNHISLLFVQKDFHRRGIARRLFESVVEDCRKDREIDRITVNSSPYAVEAYRHLGFRETGPEQEVNGIRFTPMDYRLECL